MKSAIPVAALAVALMTAGAARAASVSFKTPSAGMHFTEGVPVRILADGIDPEGWQWNFGRLEADLVIFYVDGAEIARAEPTDGRINWFEAYTRGLSAGTHVLRLESHNFGGVIARSAPLSIVVDAVPAKPHAVTLTQDIVLSGSTDLTWNDTIVRGNGFKVRASANWRGDVVITNSFVTGLGALGVAGIDVATSGDVTIDGTVFEDTGAVHVRLDGRGNLEVTNNEFRANNRIAFEPSDPDRSPVLYAAGATSGSKRFSGNRVGAGIVYFEGMSDVLVGGDSDAAGNVFMGPRAVLRFFRSPGAIVRGNYSHHVYRGGWSQGFNVLFGESPDQLVEHNVIRSGSWPVQDVDGVFRYNLVIDVGHSWIRTAATGARIYRNVFVHNSGAEDHSGIDAGIWFYTDQTGIQVYNNTFDAGGPASAIAAPALAVSVGTRVATFHNNVVTGFTTPASRALVARFTSGGSGSVIDFADYNLFHNPSTTAPSYESGAVVAGNGAHDIAGNPRFAVGTQIPYAIDEALVWNRVKRVSEVLAHYRQLYEPASGSPLIDAGSPTGTSGADIGAVENAAGAPRADDMFGKFPSAAIQVPQPPTDIDVR
jgi:hypothetical protein